MDGGIDLDLPTLLPSFSSTQIILYFILPNEATEYFINIAKAPKWKKKIWLQKRAAKSKKCPHYHGAQGNIHFLPYPHHSHQPPAAPRSGAHNCPLAESFPNLPTLFYSLIHPVPTGFLPWSFRPPAADLCPYPRGGCPTRSPHRRSYPWVLFPTPPYPYPFLLRSPPSHLGLEFSPFSYHLFSQ